MKKLLDFDFFRIHRSRQFGLDHHWLVKVDLEHREIERRNNKTSIDVKH